MTNNKHKEIMDEVERKSEVINDNLWYVNPENIKIALTEQLEEIERWVETKRRTDDTQMSDDRIYDEALVDILFHLHSKKEEYKKV